MSSSLCLSCFVRSFSKKYSTFLINCKKPDNSSGLKPSVYLMYHFNNAFNLYFASKKIGENIAAMNAN